MLKKKEDETNRKIEEAKQAAKDAGRNYQKAQEMKFHQYHASVKRDKGTDLE